MNSQLASTFWSSVRSVYTYLTMTAGPKVGASVLLGEAAHQLRLGRQADCDIQLDDPVCSRVHAQLWLQGGQWHIRDLSRNGTFVNNERTAEQPLLDGDTIRMGQIEFTFHQSEQSPTTFERIESAGFHEPVPSAKSPDEQTLQASLSTLSAAAMDYKDLCRLAVNMLQGIGHRLPNWDQLALEFVHARVGGAYLVWFELQSPQTLVARRRNPRQAPLPALSASLKFLLLQEGRPVWTSHQSPADCRAGMSDGLWAPIAIDGRIAAVLFAGLEQGQFRQSHFELVVSLARLISEAMRLELEQFALGEGGRLEGMDGKWTGHIPGDSPAAARLREQLREASQYPSAALRGEPGVEFELAVRQLHQASGNRDRPLIRLESDDLNGMFAGQPPTDISTARSARCWWLLERGHGSGALVWIAHLERLTLPAQAKLCEILKAFDLLPATDDGRQAMPLAAAPPGGQLADSFSELPLWLVGSTSLSSSELLCEESMMPELAAWIEQHAVNIPPWRERAADVEAWLEYGLAVVRQTLGKPELLLTPTARSKLLTHRWPGHFAEMQSTLYAAACRCRDAVLGLEHFDLSEMVAGSSGYDTLRWSVWEKRLVEAALHQSGGNMAEAARLLGIGRATLYRKLEAQDRDPDDS